MNELKSVKNKKNVTVIVLSVLLALAVIGFIWMGVEATNQRGLRKNAEIELTFAKVDKYAVLNKMYNLFISERRSYFNYYLIMNNVVGNISDKSLESLQGKLKTITNGTELEEIIELTSNQYELTFQDFTEEDMHEAIKDYFDNVEESNE
ncbi:MAG: hypothetical protein EZS26_000233 [Candidatus Ordinivivax streblomastigis]|uniref:Uncharacterized protein n=1 Tax=Candidatus Ordinivivax streblomastigis TaxID=2540710 RepID=A0A5M8P5U9_9BACT|nr:MAG: hypothetical protein EZS26_000233 [Candidatus Ordinivivax streblomastigis]